MPGLNFTFKHLSFRAPRDDLPVPAPPPGISRHFLNTPSGRIELLYTTPKDASEATPILFVHGGMGSAWVWTEYMQYLAARGVPSYAVSMRGHGHSWHPSYLRMVFMTFRSDLTQDVLAALRFVEEKHEAMVMLVGHSSGGGLVQGLLADGKARVKALALLGAVPCSGSLGVYMNWAKCDPWFSFRMILHGYHPNSPLSHPTLVRRIFFSDAYPDADIPNFMAHGSTYEAFFWPFSMMYSFAKPDRVLRNIDGGTGDKLMVMTGTVDAIMTRDIMRRMGVAYRAAQARLIAGKKNDVAGEAATREVEEDDNSRLGVRVTWVPNAGHHLQNDVTWQIGARKLLHFYEQI